MRVAEPARSGDTARASTGREGLAEKVRPYAGRLAWGGFLLLLTQCCEKAIPWLFRGFRICLAVTLGWAALVPAEAFVAWLPATSLGLAFAACFALRAVSLEILLAGARGLGVLGRRFEL